MSYLYLNTELVHNAYSSNSSQFIQTNRGGKKLRKGDEDYSQVHLSVL